MSSRGFSLIELMIVLVVFGTLVGFGVPAFQRYAQSQALIGASQNLVQTVQLQRTRAMATAQTVTLVFDTSSTPGWRSTSGGVTSRYQLPRNVRFASVNPGNLSLTRDGRVNTSGLVVLQNQRGSRDTVSIMVSGLALRR